MNQLMMSMNIYNDTPLEHANSRKSYATLSAEQQRQLIKQRWVVKTLLDRHRSSYMQIKLPYTEARSSHCDRRLLNK
ncbi:hypothetical protein DMENIID0001_120330 [Sergentomyia squamirostris]